MRRTSKLLFTLADDGGPLHRRLYQRMRGLILDGSWPAGTKIPSSRALAEELGVSRNTALHAIDLLVADGWIQSQRGSAMYVSTDAPRPLPHLGTLESSPKAPADPVPFEIGRQTAEFFPLSRWNRLQSEIWAESGSTMLYGTETGEWPALARALAVHVGAARNLRADPRQIIVLASTQAAVDLVTRCVAEPGDQAWVEDPGYHLAHQLFRLNGMSPVPIPVDDEGLRVTDGRKLAPKARIAYVTAACQFPTGFTMSLERRRELLDWASETGGWIIEDDWEWHAHFMSSPALPPLQSLPGGERVIYIQTFNRTVFPGLRLAFMIAPPDLARDLFAMNQRISGGPNVPVQATLARFLDEGLYAAHLRITRAAYADRRDALLAALSDLPEGFTPRADREGLHLVVDVPDGCDDAKLAAFVRSEGIACTGMSEFAIANPRQRGLILGFAAFAPDQIEAGALRFVQAIRMSAAT